jgi:hypothetical protein
MRYIFTSLLLLSLTNSAWARRTDMLRNLAEGSVLNFGTPVELPSNQSGIFFVRGHRELPRQGSTFCALEGSGNWSGQLKGRLRVTQVTEEHDLETGAYFGTSLTVMQEKDPQSEELLAAPVSRIRCVRDLEVGKVLNIWVNGEAMDSYPTDDGMPPTVQDLFDALAGVATLEG